MGPRANDRSESPSAALQILQTELVELVELALQIQQMKWTLVPEVPALSTRLLTDVVADAWYRADAVAEELRARGTAPDARIRTIAASPALYPTQGGWLEPSTVARAANAIGRSATWARERSAQLEGEPELERIFVAISSGLDEWVSAVRAVSTR
jgi:DNA-binding ferritin-like protein